MSNPIMEALVSAKVSDLIHPPRSWGNAEKVAFLHLPRELQAFYAEREAQRDREVRRCQSDRAEAIKKLAAAEARLEQAEARIKALTEQQEKLANVETEAAI